MSRTNGKVTKPSNIEPGDEIIKFTIKRNQISVWACSSALLVSVPVLSVEVPDGALFVYLYLLVMINI